MGNPLHPYRIAHERAMASYTAKKVADAKYEQTKNAENLIEKGEKNALYIQDRLAMPEFLRIAFDEGKD